MMRLTFGPHRDRGMRAKALEYMIAIKQAELHDVADLLRWQPSIARLLPPDLWVEHLGELSRLHDCAGRLSGRFEALVRDAYVPRQRFAAPGPP
jgi:hypothetical protein